jgi:hypothetical protein
MNMPMLDGQTTQIFVLLCNLNTGVTHLFTEYPSIEKTDCSTPVFVAYI